MGFVGVPLLLIKSERLFESEEVSIMQAFSCLTAVLTKLLFLERTPDPGGEMLRLQLLQVQQVFVQDGLPRLKWVHALAFHEPVEQDVLHAPPLSHEEW